MPLLNLRMSEGLQRVSLATSTITYYSRHILAIARSLHAYVTAGFFRELYLGVLKLLTIPFSASDLSVKY